MPDFFNVFKGIGEAAEAASKTVGEAAKAAGDAAGAAAKAAGDAASAAAKVASDAANAAGAAAGEVAEGVAKTANEAAGAASKTVSEAVDAAGKATGDTQKTVGDAAIAAGKTVGGAVAVVGATAGAAAITAVSVGGEMAANAAGAVATQATNAVQAAQESVGKVVSYLNENSRGNLVKQAKIASFRDGMKRAAQLEMEQRLNHYFALISLAACIAHADNDFSQEEIAAMQELVELASMNGGIPEEAQGSLHAIALDETISFEGITKYLDKVDTGSLRNYQAAITKMMQADGVISEEEIRVEQAYFLYLEEREALDEEADNPERRTYLLTDAQIEEEVAKYATVVEDVSHDFLERTSLQKEDMPILATAIALQVIRMFAINYFKQANVKQNAGEGNKLEDSLHKKQDKLLGSHDDKSPAQTELHASLHEICTLRGVPYDATKFESENYGFFEGANHRFATLGHDPILGLVFGTANIMTKTITTNSMPNNPFGLGIPLIRSYHVHYDPAFKNPSIADPVPTLAVLGAAANRLTESDGMEALACATLKQLIHIATDINTTKGLSLPGAALVMSPRNIEILTEYVSVGDAMVEGASAGLSILINKIIAAIHGSMMLEKEDGDLLSRELYEVRTRKIILLSNTIASGSNVLLAAVKPEMMKLDIGGLAVTIFRLITDAHFMTKIKYEYLNAATSEKYKLDESGILNYLESM